MKEQHQETHRTASQVSPHVDKSIDTGVLSCQFSPRQIPQPESALPLQEHALDTSGAEGDSKPPVLKEESGGQDPNVTHKIGRGRWKAKMHKVMLVNKVVDRLTLTLTLTLIGE